MTRARLLALVLSLCCFAAGPARAQTHDAEVAEATRLYDEAEALMQATRYAEACERYARSHALDPQLGSLLHLANCEEQLGRTASAARDFQAAAQLAAARQDPREAVARKRAEQLTAQLAYLRLVPPPAAPAALQVSLDGVPVAPDRRDSFAPIDPGPHEVRVFAPGYVPWSHVLSIAPATRHELPLPQLTAEPVTPAADSGEQTARAPAPAVAGTPPRSIGAQRVAAYAIGGAALVGIGVAAVLGTRANHFLGQRDALCPGERCVLSMEAASQTRALDAKARDFAAAFNWTGALSLAALGGAVLLYATGAERAEPPAHVSLGWGSISVHGRL